MAKKRSSSPATKPPPPAQSSALTGDRIVRLYHLVRLLGRGRQTRAGLQRKLRLDVRGFYRDLDSLRTAGVDVVLADGRYNLGQTVETAFARLPFPDPQLTCGEAMTLARGKTAAHRKLKQQITILTG